MKKAARSKQKDSIPTASAPDQAKPAQAPDANERVNLVLALGDRQYLIQKLAAEMGQITKRLDELNAKLAPVVAQANAAK